MNQALFRRSSVVGNFKPLSHDVCYFPKVPVTGLPTEISASEIEI